MLCLKFAFLLWIGIWLSCGVHADLSPQATPLLRIVSASDLIVAARLTKIVSDPTRHPDPDRIHVTGGADLNVPGTYKFQVLAMLRGKCEPTLSLFLPVIDSSVYNYAKPQIAEGTVVLLFLQSNHHTKEVAWGLSDSTLPLLVLTTNTVELLNNDKEKTLNVVARIIDLVLATIKDSTLRQANLFAIRNVVNERIPKALLPYIDDADPQRQTSVLYCLAANQHAAAIPHIARIEADLYRQHNGGGCIEALQVYHTPEAIPYLNPLLFEVSVFTRLNAAMTLRRLADRTSIPYLVAAMQDSDVDVAYQSYAALYRLIPGLGAAKTVPEFEAHREGVSAPIYAWWREELNGKHLSKPYE